MGETQKKTPRRYRFKKKKRQTTALRTKVSQEGGARLLLPVTLAAVDKDFWLKSRDVLVVPQPFETQVFDQRALKMAYVEKAWLHTNYESVRSHYHCRASAQANLGAVPIEAASITVLQCLLERGQRTKVHRSPKPTKAECRT